MKIGYPALNLTLHPKRDKSFSVTQRAKGRALAQAAQHIRELRDILAFNTARSLFFFRIRPDLQIHAGERFHGDKAASIGRFVERFALLDDLIKRRLVIENENVLCTVKDCLAIHIRTGLPIVPDVLHHEIDILKTDPRVVRGLQAAPASCEG